VVDLKKTFIFDQYEDGRREKRERERLTCIPTFVECFYSGCRFVLPIKACVNVSNQMISYIIAHMHFQNIPIFDQFTKHVLICSPSPNLISVFTQTQRKERVNDWKHTEFLEIFISFLLGHFRFQSVWIDWRSAGRSQMRVRSDLWVVHRVLVHVVNYYGG